MIKFFGQNNDLRTEDGRITGTGYAVMALSSVFGFCMFLMGRTIYGKSLKKKQADRPSLVGIVAEHKKAHHEKQFPLDLEKARQMGKELGELSNVK